jgi:hypothetical protein
MSQQMTLRPSKLAGKRAASDAYNTHDDSNGDISECNWRSKM